MLDTEAGSPELGAELRSLKTELWIDAEEETRHNVNSAQDLRWNGLRVEGLMMKWVIVSELKEDRWTSPDR